MENIQELKSQLSIPKDITLIMHRNPDGDAVGSTLALYFYLKKHAHTIHMVAPSEYPEFLNWLPATDEILIYDLDPEAVEKVINRSNFVFCLDFNALDRIDKVGDLVVKRNVPTAMIDHHLYPEPFADYIFSDTTASSTCEMIYDFIHLLGDEKYLDTTIGECIYTGIVTDTGSFKYGTSAKLFRVVADLLELGVNDYLLQDLIFNSFKEKHLRLLGHCLHNRMEILPEYKTGIITLTKEDYTNFDIVRGDTEGIVNYLLRIKDVKMAAFITEQPTIVKISLRSKGEFSVQDIARKHFKGGGHRNAAGGASFIGLDATVRKFKELLPRYRDVLQRI